MNIAQAQTRFYVLGKSGGGLHWVLSLDGYATQSLAQRAINWQRQGQGEFDPADHWAIAQWNADLCGFVVEGETVRRELSEGPYTEAAWRDFIRGLGVECD
jgi:hypothetical protein